MDLSQFAHYKDPVKAEAIYREYAPDIERLGRKSRAEAIVTNTTDSRRLDILLDRLINARTSHPTRGRNNSYN